MISKIKVYENLDTQLCYDLKEVWIEIIDENGDAVGEVKRVNKELHLVLYQVKQHISIPEKTLKNLFSLASKNIK